MLSTSPALNQWASSKCNIWCQHKSAHLASPHLPSPMLCQWLCSIPCRKKNWKKKLKKKIYLGVTHQKGWHQIWTSDKIKIWGVTHQNNFGGAPPKFKITYLSIGIQISLFSLLSLCLHSRLCCLQMKCYSLSTSPALNQWVSSKCNVISTTTRNRNRK